MLKGYVCPPESPTAGNRNDATHCLSGCPHPCVSPPLLAAIWSAEQRNHHQGAYISASMLSGGGCRRQVFYERFFDFYESPRRRWWPFRGSMAHRIVEDAGGVVEPYGWLQELRMAVPLEFPDERAPIYDAEGNLTGQFSDTEHLVVTLGGTTDAYNPFLKAIHDYKTMADMKVAGFIKGQMGGKYSPHFGDSWVIQLNIYRWLIAHTPITRKWKNKFKKHGLTPPAGKFFPAPEELKIQGIGMMEIPQTGNRYTPMRSGESFEIDPIPVLPLDEIEQIIRAGALQWYDALVLGHIPPVAPKKDQWMCKSCPFNGELIEGERCFPKNNLEKSE